MDWYGWHDGYRDGGPLRERLALVEDQLRLALDTVRPGPVMIISVCAGQGHDVGGVVSEAPRRQEIRARLVEWDERNVTVARDRMAAAGLSGIDVRQGDAGITDAYADVVPAQIVLACGVFGSLTDSNVDSMVGSLPQLCDKDAQVIWTSHRSTPNLYQEVETAFRRHGFVSLWSDPDDRFGVSRYRLDAEPQPLQPARRMFQFADEQTLIDIGRIS